MAQTRFRVLLSDVGGVLGTNGWDTALRDGIIQHFGLNLHEVSARHRLMFDSYERGFMTFEEYLNSVFFESPRAFTTHEVRSMAYDASTPWPECIDFLRLVKDRNALKVGLISNEGEGLTQHRVRKFGLGALADFMIFSYFVHMRKPDPAIWQLALDLLQVSPDECIYIDDRKMFAEIAGGMGLTAIHHTSVGETRARLMQLGLETE